MTEKPFERLVLLNARAAEQRQRFAERLSTARNRLRPSNLAHEAGNRALDLGLNGIEKARKLAREKPAKIVVAAIAAGAVLGRKPLARLFKAGWTKFRDRKAAEGKLAGDGESED